MSDFIADRLVKEYQSGSQILRVLDGVSIELDRGHSLAIVGPSGSGKSTLLHICGTLDEPTSGTVSLAGTDLNQIGPTELASFRNQNIGFVFQEHFLLPQLTALENVLLPLVARGKSGPESVDRGKALLDRVGLKDRFEHRPGMLSGGERQRVAVARALIGSPLLILADEPTGSLDEANSESVGELLIDLQRQEEAILICVTHRLSLANRFQKQARLEQGTLVPSPTFTTGEGSR